MLMEPELKMIKELARELPDAPRAPELLTWLKLRPRQGLPNY